MRRFLLVAGATLALSASAHVSDASAASLPTAAVGPGQVVAKGPMTKLNVEGAQYARRCGYWRAECSRRWGFRTWRYTRCMRFHAC
jgi:hypothetical protein